MAHIWWGPVVFRWYSFPAASLISGLFTSPSLLRMRYTVDSDTENPMLSVTHEASCRGLSSGISLADDRTWPTSLEGQSVPWGLASSRIILQSSLLTPPQPPVVGAPGHSKLSQDLTLGHGRRGYLDEDLCLLHGAHPLVPVSSWSIGIAVF